MSAITSTEQVLHDLCTRSFLSYWSFPNPYRSEGGVAKEMCDALVVCDKYVIVFSDKGIGFPAGALNVAWARWMNKSVKASVKQLQGAYRFLQFPQPAIFADHSLKRKIRVDIAPPADREIHLVSIANGATVAAWQHFGSEISTLMITNDPLVDRPFTLGNVSSGGEFVHVFTDASLSLVMREFDTLIDLVAYLRNRKKFIQGSTPFTVAGEEELISLYFRGYDDRSKSHDMQRALPRNTHDYTSVTLHGYWDDLIARPEYKARVEANHVSYDWDKLIERFAKHQIEGTGTSEKPPEIGNHEGGLRYMALESRVHRRMLAEGIVAAYEAFPSDRNFLSRSIISPGAETIYVFIQLARGEGQQYAEHRSQRRTLLQIYACSLLERQSTAARVVGIAVDPSGQGHGQYSEDMILVDRAFSPPERLAEMTKLKEQFNDLISTTTSTSLLRTTEFPH